MRLLFLGDIGLGQTSRMRMHALSRLGYEVRGIDTVEPWRRASWTARQWQRRLAIGPVVKKINASIRETAQEFKPDLVWAEKQEFLEAETIESMRTGGAWVVHFTPDPYFYLAWKRTRLMDEAMRHFDVLVYCKSYERCDYEALQRPVIYMPLGFCDEIHRPLPSSMSCWNAAVGFLGGWEPRRECLLSAIAQTGVDLKIWGGYWDFLRDGKWTLRRQIILSQLAGGESFRIRTDPALAKTLQGNEVYGDNYARALTGSRIGVGFLRKVCPDQHTTRTFEIPACASMLLADRTDEHREFFEEAREADFFDSEDELTDKISFYTTNESSRMRIAAAGRERCVKGRYAYVHRLSDALTKIKTAIFYS